jgi:hypothetical protein
MLSDLSPKSGVLLWIVGVGAILFDPKKEKAPFAGVLGFMSRTEEASPFLSFDSNILCREASGLNNMAFFETGDGF